MNEPETQSRHSVPRHHAPLGSAPLGGYTERELLKLPNSDLRLLLKKLKITGWLQTSKADMARQIVERMEKRERFKKLARYNDKLTNPAAE